MQHLFVNREPEISLHVRIKFIVECCIFIPISGTICMAYRVVNGQQLGYMPPLFVRAVTI
jgi:hypothetical protein